MGHWRLAYTLAGMVLGCALVFGLLVLRALFAPDPELWLVMELQPHALCYYGLAAGVAVLGLGLVGRAIGKRQDQLELSSSIDPLTELPNRRYFGKRLREELMRASRYGVPVTLLVIDVDDMKQINDRHGHAAGDRALCSVAESLRRTCRATDVPVRSGGDEFAVLVPETFAEDAMDLAKRIQLDLRQEAAKTGDTPALSISIGMADVARAGGAAALSESADHALYVAKAAGRNRIVLAPPRRAGSSRARQH